jgi:hypothetical protein
MNTGTDTDVVTGSAAARATEYRPSLSTVRAILDVVRPPGRALRVLEVASAAGSLATLASPDEVVSLDRSAWDDPAPTRVENAYDCAIAIDAVHRLEPDEQRRLLTQLRRAARAAVLVEAPRPSSAENPFEEAIELFRELGDSVLVVGAEHLPTLFALREAGLAGEPAGRSDHAGQETAEGRQWTSSPSASRSVLVSIIDPDAVGVELSGLRSRFALPDVGGRDRDDLAVLALSVEIRRLSERLDRERVTRDRAEAEAVDLRAKLAELTRVASEDRAAREAAEALVEVVAAARGYRIGLVLCHARAALRRRLSRVARVLTAPWRASVARLRRGAAAPSGR